MSPWLKAGLIGGAVLVVLNLLSLIPVVGLVFCLLGILAYIGIGVLAAYWIPPQREAGQAAGQGALAAGLAALIGGIVNTITTTIQMTLTDTSAIISQIPAETLQQMEDVGVDPNLLFGTGTGALSGALCGGICCVAGLILAAILGAIGGAVFAGIRPD
jgi:hypothetical protein